MEKFIETGQQRTNTHAKAINREANDTPDAWHWSISQSGEILDCGEPVVKITGYSPSFLKSKPLDSIIKDEASQRVIETAMEADTFPYDVRVTMETLKRGKVEVILSFMGVREIKNGRGVFKREFYGRIYPALNNRGMSLAHSNLNVGTETTFIDPDNDPGKINYSSIQKKSQFKNHFLWMALPLVFFIFFGIALLIERRGPSYQTENAALNFINAPQMKRVNPALIGETSDTLLLFDSTGIEGRALSENMAYVLQSMRVKFDTVDVAKSDFGDVERYQAVVIAFTDLEKISDQSFNLMEWVEEGGGLLFAIRPDPSATFTAIYRKLGIQSKYDELQMVTGLAFQTDIIPGAKSLTLDESFLSHSSLIVKLVEDSKVHVISADRYQMPLLWETSFGEGQIVFINSDQFTLKSARGTLASAYSLLFDVFAYPVINSSIFFIDDFPAPIPQGTHAVITQEFGRDIPSFYINVWWPDMQSLSRRFGIKYTGVVIETYDEDVAPPFEPQRELDSFKYFGTSLLNDGGEIGYHGYNHVPLCLNKIECKNQFGYPFWPSEEAMAESLKTLAAFNSVLFREATFSTYVPPSNILSARAREMLPDALPGIKVVASVYIPDGEDYAYVQEFEEAEDGIIELPRITSGYRLNDFMKWTALNEIGMHYMQAHFVHPDDVLDDIRSEGSSWTSLRRNIEEHFLWLASSNPQLRPMTAREGAMALQRYARLDLDRSFENQAYRITIENFHDQAWLLMRSKTPPVAVEGGLIDDLGSGLYLVQAISPEITIQFED